MGYGTDGLSFNTLRAVNMCRAGEARAYDKCKHWTHAQWMQALVGEVGELANILKKVDRGDYPIEQVKPEIEKELADIQIYLDLLASNLDVHLGKATAAKFNEVSRRRKVDVYIKYDLSDYVLDEDRSFGREDK